MSWNTGKGERCREKISEVGEVYMEEMRGEVGRELMKRKEEEGRYGKGEKGQEIWFDIKRKGREG